ncbi:MAG: Nif3-like dinuclear metal center hexameric protein [Chitinispirillales bacterium]|jgi:dinuclear metal center YbgI/SA1388 family protein|nr:Nif3-like dinuclear metal center hexameric protein [Chitinispirillales bacterium]
MNQRKTRANQKVSRDTIVSFLDKTLRTSEIGDSSINGLQVEGTNEITKVGLAVDACLEAYKLAEKNGCQMVIVHHGMIWDGIKYIRGPLLRQLDFLISNKINLYGSHLPLDLHPTLGNNAHFAKLVGLKNLKPFGMYKNGLYLSVEGAFSKAVTLESVGKMIKEGFGGPVSYLPFGPKKIRTAALVSGRGSSALAEAVEKGIDLFITGELIHESYTIALEGGINVVCGGHYHTEKSGVQALGRLLSEKFGVESVFLDVPTMF